MWHHITSWMGTVGGPSEQHNNNRIGYRGGGEGKERKGKIRGGFSCGEQQGEDKKKNTKKVEEENNKPQNRSHPVL